MKKILLFLILTIMISTTTLASHNRPETEIDKHNNFRITADIPPTTQGYPLDIWVKLKNNDPNRKISITIYSWDINIFHTLNFKLNDDEGRWSHIQLPLPANTKPGEYYLTIRVDDPHGHPNEKSFKKHIPFLIY